MDGIGIAGGVKSVFRKFYDLSGCGCAAWMQRLLRVGIGGLFLYAGLIKVVDVDGFARQVMVYDILPWEAVNLFSLWIVSVEIVAGVLLISGIWVRPAALILAMLCLVFIIAIASALARGMQLRCGCFSPAPSGELRTWFSLWREAGLLAGCLWLTFFLWDTNTAKDKKGA